MKMTVPQIIMLNHAAWVNWKRTEARSDAKAKAKEEEAKLDQNDPKVFRGKRLSELNSDEMAQYYSLGALL